MSKDIFEKLYEVLQNRKNSSKDESYVASLYEGGSQKIAEKIIEEAQEFIDEAYLLDNSPNDPITKRNFREEAADLFFHSLVMLAHYDVSPEELFKILEERFGISGFEVQSNRIEAQAVHLSDE